LEAEYFCRNRPRNAAHHRSGTAFEAIKNDIFQYLDPKAKNNFTTGRFLPPTGKRPGCLT
jgi:hypothetical protein